MNKLACSTLAFAVLLHANCSNPENDGRKYHSNASPLQGKMGVTFTRVRSTLPPTPPTQESAPITANADPAPPPPAEEGLLGRFGRSDGPPGLLDRNLKPDEPGADYWMHAQQSPNPVQSKMGVRVTRRKK